MAIEDIVNELCKRNQLFPFVPGGILAGVERRKLYLSEGLNRLVTGPDWQDAAERGFGMEIAANFIAFVQQELLSVRVGPPKRDRAQIAQLLPHRVLEFRCSNATPNARVFGFLAAKDLFVALTLEYRQPLGRFGSKKWLQAIAGCEVAWTRILPFENPLSKGVFPDDYISGAVHS